jgi:hypothetical protein
LNHSHHTVLDLLIETFLLLSWSFQPCLARCGQLNRHQLFNRRRRRLRGQNSQLHTLLTMTRKTGLSGTQATCHTTRRRCHLRKIASETHTKCAPSTHRQQGTTGQTRLWYCSGHSTQVLPRSVDGNVWTLYQDSLVEETHRKLLVNRS